MVTASSSVTSGTSLTRATAVISGGTVTRSVGGFASHAFSPAFAYRTTEILGLRASDTITSLARMTKATAITGA